MKIEMSSVFLPWADNLTYFTYTRIITDGYVEPSSSTVSFTGLLIPKVSNADQPMEDAGIDFTGMGTIYAKGAVSLFNGDEVTDVETGAEWLIRDTSDYSNISNFKKYLVQRKNEE